MSCWVLGKCPNLLHILFEAMVGVAQPAHKLFHDDSIRRVWLHSMECLSQAVQAVYGSVLPSRSQFTSAPNCAVIRRTLFGGGAPLGAELGKPPQEPVTVRLARLALWPCRKKTAPITRARER